MLGSFDSFAEQYVVDSLIKDMTKTVLFAGELPPVTIAALQHIHIFHFNSLPIL